MKIYYWIIKNLHLLISLGIVVPTAIIYGSPSILPQQLDIQVNTIDLSNMLKAIMGLYIGISLVWILGIWKTQYWKRATKLNILFMLTLAIGRGLSMITDGIPTNGYIFGITAELLLGLFSIYQLRKYNCKEKKLQNHK
ncbi:MULTISPECIES: DUF4345 domain-containing protein [unclassified Tenacibaculum]|uniref:DUF4345 domain-containing protein n=1 Tax=unclassified Tenacibaculum TaxID=2635139 RepID=UPI001F34C297|nr:MULTISPECIES: DUF4345 domain-containing protein [unclassified Tenacibaculum]MCF2876470.1 DUF4345 domain-containing protein [Tenacibaculum sp. Cn5-1]MCF2936623.1 DUF4345 domain-containing protein [Tenacibaculum sp. Cn5-34]MCG7511784.1 DUF4345 domain-containing protein [Tenacibaculum sp. Cn5-46]